MSEEKLPRIHVGVACYGNQAPQWWSMVMAMLMSGNGVFYDITRVATSSSMMQDTNKNHIVEWKRRSSMTDENRNNIAQGFIESDADYLFFIDDDTVPPPSALARLLSLKREFVSGLYFLPKEPHNPIAYFRVPERGLYAYYTGYAKGTVIQVDAVGMGCALIHRSVFDKIVEKHTLFVRPNGSFAVVPNRLVKNKKEAPKMTEPYVKDGFYHIPVKEPHDDDDRFWPFFMLEYSRTEDMLFCEMCNEVGVRPYLDTTVVCEHIKQIGVNEEDYKRGLVKESQKAGLAKEL